MSSMRITCQRTYDNTGESTFAMVGKIFGVRRTTRTDLTNYKFVGYRNSCDKNQFYLVIKPIDLIRTRGKKSSTYILGNGHL